MIVIARKLDQKSAQRLYNDLLKWFASHPERIDCRTDLFGTMNKATLKQDVMACAIKGVKLTIPSKLGAYSKGSEDLYAKRKKTAPLPTTKIKKTKKTKKTKKA